MFRVSCNGGYAGRRTICSGVAFGRVEAPIVFKIEANGVANPLIVQFFIRDDPTKPSVYYVLNPMYDDRIDIEFFNVSSNGASACGDPVSVVSAQGVDLQLIFHVDRIQMAPNFRLTYEFFEVVQ